MSTPISISLALQPSLHSSHTRHARRKPRKPIDTRGRSGSTASSASSSACPSPFCNSPTQSRPTTATTLGTSSSQAPVSSRASAWTDPPTNSANSDPSTLQPSRSAPPTSISVPGPCTRCVSNLAVPLATSSGTTATSLVNATTVVRRERPSRGTGRDHGPMRRDRSNTLLSYLHRSRAEQSTGVRASTTSTASAASRFISSFPTLPSLSFSSSLHQSPPPRPSPGPGPGHFSFALPTFPALPALPSFPSFHYPGPSILSRFSYTSSSPRSADLSTPRPPHSRTGSPTRPPRTHRQSCHASRGSAPRSMHTEQDPNVLWKAFAQFKQQVIDSHPYQQWESMTEQWQWHLWYRESVFEEHEYDQERDAQRRQHHYRPSLGQEREQLPMNQHDCTGTHHRPQRAHHLHTHTHLHPQPYPHPHPHPHPLSDPSMRSKKSTRHVPTAPENTQEPINDSPTTTTATTATTTRSARECMSTGLGDKAIEAQEDRKRSDGLLKKDSRGRFGFEPRVFPTLSASDLVREDHTKYLGLDEEEQYQYQQGHQEEQYQYQQGHQQQQQRSRPMVDSGHIGRSTTLAGPRRGQNYFEAKAHEKATREKSRNPLHVDISLPIHTIFNYSSSCFLSPTLPAAAAATASASCAPFASSFPSSSLLPPTSNPTLTSSPSSSPSPPIETPSSPSTNSPSPSSTSAPSSICTHADTMPGTVIQPSIPSSTHSPLSPKKQPCPHSTSTKITATATTTTATVTTSTTRTISPPSIPSLSGSYAATTAVLTSSLQTVRSAGERGRDLAQRSRFSLNRFLGAMVEATTTLSGGSSGATSQASCRDHQNLRQPAHGGSERYDGRYGSMCTPPVSMQPLPPQLAISNILPSPPSRQLSARAKFFVCEEDSDDESVDEIAPQYLVAPPQLVPTVPSEGEQPGDAGCEDSFIDQAEDAEEWIFEKTSVIPQIALRPSRDYQPDMRRRQSLLSDLFMAERTKPSQQRASESATGAKHSRPNGYRHMPASKSLSRCHSAANSDGESSHVGEVPTHELYPTTPACVHHHHNSHYYTHHEGIEAQDTEVNHRLYIQHPKVSRSGLTRTKKSMFKNLDELVLTASTNPSDPSTASPGRCSPVSEQGTRIQSRLHLQTQNVHSPPRRYSHVPMPLKV